MIRLIRYELCYCDEKQDVGFLIGLEDTGLPEEDVEALIEGFNDWLAVPPYQDFEENQLKNKAYFTEYGLSLFQQQVQLIKKALSEKSPDWEVVEEVILIEENDSRILYQDAEQVVLSVG